MSKPLKVVLQCLEGLIYLWYFLSGKLNVFNKDSKYLIHFSFKTDITAFCFVGGELLFADLGKFPASSIQVIELPLSFLGVEQRNIKLI